MCSLFKKFFSLSDTQWAGLQVLLLIPFLSACTLEASLRNLSSKDLNSSAPGINATAPDVSTVVLNDGTTEWAKTKTATLTWTAATDSSPGIGSYHLALGTTPGGTDIQDWTAVGDVTAINSRD